MKNRILVINGPNLNMLGRREPEIYGSMTLEDIFKNLHKTAASIEGVDIEIEEFQSNHEGAIVERIQAALDDSDAIIINAGAFTHTSIAIRDALASFKKPVIEVHLSNIFKREEFRHSSYISGVSNGIISGFGPHSYVLALEAAVELLRV